MLIPHDHITILDGAMGTMLQAAGLPLGKYPEALNLTHPADITAIHRAYAQAGAQILYANTFGANRRKLEGSGLRCGKLFRRVSPARGKRQRKPERLSLSPAARSVRCWNRTETFGLRRPMIFSANPLQRGRKLALISWCLKP